MKAEIVKKVLLSEGVKKAGMAGVAVLGVGAVANAMNKPKEEKEVLDYMQYTPATLSAQTGVYMSMGPREGESLDDFLARMQLEREKKLSEDYDGYYNDDFYAGIEDKLQVGVLIEDKESLKEVLGEMKTPRIRKITKNLYNNGVLYDTTVSLLSEIEQKMVHIKDTKVLSLIYKMCDELANLQVREEERKTVFGQVYKADSVEDLCKIERLLETIDKTIDSYNNITDKYVTYKDYRYNSDDGTFYRDLSSTQKFVEYFDNDEEDNELRIYLKQAIFDGKETNNLFVKDFLTAQKTENFIPLREGEEKEYLYNLYLKKADLPASIKARCKKIKEEYGIMTIPPYKDVATSAYFNFIEDELKAWKEAGGDEVKYPKVLDLNLINERFVDYTEGYCDSMTGKIQLKGHKLSNLKFALRHELMHLNDKLINTHMIGQERAKFLEEIMPTKTLNGRVIRDFKNCKYKDEFLRAGIDPKHISYAYRKRAEFIAVAAEGDMSKYSPEFKEVLKRLGMPDFAFNLKTINRDVQRRVNLMEKVFEKHPDEKNFNKLVKYYNQEKVENLSMEEKLLQALFGGNF